MLDNVRRVSRQLAAYGTADVAVLAINFLLFGEPPCADPISFTNERERRDAGTGPVLSITVEELKRTAARYLGEERVERSFADFAESRGTKLEAYGEADVQLLRFTENLLASAIGAASSRLVLSLLLRRRAVGMKSALNGGLQLSVLDGWWAEAFDGHNGWGFGGEVDGDHGAQDARDGTAFNDALEHEVIPSYYERDDAGLPRAWIARMKASLRTLGPRFDAARMVADYVERAYTPPTAAGAAGGAGSRQPSARA